MISQFSQPPDGLTKRQLEVLSMIGDEMNTKTMAKRIGVSPKTIEAHRTKLNGIFKTGSTVKLAKIAIAFGLSSLCVVLLAGCRNSYVPKPHSPWELVASAPTPLAKPVKLTSVTMSWNLVPGASSYTLFWGTSTQYGNTVTVTGTRATLQGLVVNTVYHFAVNCVVNGKPSNRSPDVAWKAIIWKNNAPAPIQ